MRTRGWPVRVAALVCGVAALAASSYPAVPMVPAPITLQTLAVTLIGALYGWRLGAATVAVWLALGAAGLPVLAEGTGGLARFAGPTAGYLFAFPAAAALTGWLTARGWDGGRPVLGLAAMLAGNGLCLLLGWSWLSTSIGGAAAFAGGVAPFVPGALIKSAIAAAVLVGLERLERPRR